MFYTIDTATVLFTEHFLEHVPTYIHIRDISNNKDDVCGMGVNHVMNRKRFALEIRNSQNGKIPKRKFMGGRYKIL